MFRYPNTTSKLAKSLAIIAACVFSSLGMASLPTAPEATPPSTGAASESAAAPLRSAQVAALWSMTGFIANTRVADTAKKLKIGISIPAADHGWTAGVVWWAKKAQALYPDVDFTLSTATTPSKQVNDIENMMVKGVDGLVILATESAPITPVAKRAHERGIYIVNVDRGFLQPVADVFIEGDNKAFGRKSAQYMVDKLNGQGKIVILEGIPCTVNTDRITAAKEIFAQYPGIEILGDQTAMWNRQKALEVMQTFLQKFPHIDAVWASDDDMAMGAWQAIREAGRDKEMWMLGGAGMKDVVKMVMDGNPMFPADITYPPSMIATGIHLCVSNLRDGHREQISQFMPRHMKLDVDLITPENAAQFFFPDSIY